MSHIGSSSICQAGTPARAHQAPRQPWSCSARGRARRRAWCRRQRLRHTHHRCGGGGHGGRCRRAGGDEGCSPPARQREQVSRCLYLAAVTSNPPPGQQEVRERYGRRKGEKAVFRHPSPLTMVHHLGGRGGGGLILFCFSGEGAFSLTGHGLSAFGLVGEV